MSYPVSRQQRVSGAFLLRQGDIFHPDFKDGSPTYIDITVVNIFKPSHIKQASACAEYIVAAATEEA